MSVFVSALQEKHICWVAEETSDLMNSYIICTKDVKYTHMV